MTFVLSRKPEVGIGQPPGNLVLDRYNPLTQGLILSCYNAVSDMERPPRNYVNGVTGIRTAVHSFGPSVGWITPANDRTNTIGNSVGSGQRTKIKNAALFNGSTSWAFIALDLSPYPVITFAVWMAVLANTDTIALEYGSNFQNNGFLFDPHGSDGGHNAPQCDDGWLPSSYQLRTLTTAPGLREMHHYMITVRRSGVYDANDFYVDGCPDLPNFFGSPGGGTAFAANGGINIGARNHGASSFSNIAIACLQIWNRALSADEQAIYFRNTWQFLRPAVCGYMPDTV